MIQAIEVSEAETIGVFDDNGSDRKPHILPHWRVMKR